MRTFQPKSESEYRKETAYMPIVRIDGPREKAEEWIKRLDEDIETHNDGTDRLSASMHVCSDAVENKLGFAGQTDLDYEEIYLAYLGGFLELFNSATSYVVPTVEELTSLDCKVERVLRAGNTPDYIYRTYLYCEEADLLIIRQFIVNDLIINM